jgi:hypothetical protein
MALKDLPEGPRAIVYEAICQALRNDPTLKTIIPPGGWRTYTGEDDSDAPPGEDSLPAIEVLPYGTAASSESMLSQSSPLGIGINVATEGLDVRDLLNLWDAVEGAIFKGDGQGALLNLFKARLNGTGARVLQVNLSQPGIAPVQSAMDARQAMAASGSILVNLIVRK